MDNFYELKVAGLKRQLPICKVNDELSIAAFIMFSDVELTVACARDLLKKAPEFDVIVTAEAKGIPLTHALAVRFGVDYVVARKSVKGYMENPITAEVKSITTTEKQMIVIDEMDAAKLDGKNVCVIDDVVSTGGSLRSVEDVLSKTGCTVIRKAAVLLEEGGYNGQDLIYLQKLPVFPL